MNSEELMKMPIEEKIALKSVKLSNGETLWYRESGSGDQTILLIHGNMTSSTHWEILMLNVDDGYKLLGIDLRGFGISSHVSHGEPSLWWPCRDVLDTII